MPRESVRSNRKNCPPVTPVIVASAPVSRPGVATALIHAGPLSHLGDPCVGEQ